MSKLAKIRWLKPDEGGRSAPPKGPRYSTVAKFDTQTEEQWFSDAWSLVLDIEEANSDGWTQVARVRFLADEAGAPTNWLRPDARFALFEGRRKVAEGIVLQGGERGDA